MFQKILIANRGEIALRIVRALRELGVPSLAVFAADDAQAPHVSAADAAVPLGASGPSAYLDGAHLLRIAREHGCDGIDRKSTRLNSSHLVISYAVFCLKKKKKHRSNSTYSP